MNSVRYRGYLLGCLRLGCLGDITFWNSQIDGRGAGVAWT
jgi:hypothetical protein